MSRVRARPLAFAWHSGSSDPRPDRSGSEEPRTRGATARCARSGDASASCSRIRTIRSTRACGSATSWPNRSGSTASTRVERLRTGRGAAGIRRAARRAAGQLPVEVLRRRAAADRDRPGALARPGRAALRRAHREPRRLGAGADREPAPRAQGRPAALGRVREPRPRPDPPHRRRGHGHVRRVA